MGFYDERETANQYIEMARGFDGRKLIDALRTKLPAGASVLELGMGPGVDLGLLSKHFRATGSDTSQFFLDRYIAMNPESDLLRLDAVELETERVFDCVYSNKVLHHLTDEELTGSVHHQSKILTPSGLIMHSFWRGTGIDEHHGLKFVYQTEDTIRSIVGEIFNILDVVVYTELEDDDSLYVLASL